MLARVLLMMIVFVAILGAAKLGVFVRLAGGSQRRLRTINVVAGLLLTAVAISLGRLA